MWRDYLTQENKLALTTRFGNGLNFLQISKIARHRMMELGIDDKKIEEVCANPHLLALFLDTVKSLNKKAD